MGLLSRLFSKQRGKYLPSLMRDYTQFERVDPSYEAAGLHLLSHHLPFEVQDPELDDEDDEPEEADSPQAHFLVRTLKEPLRLCSFLDLCLRYGLQEKLVWALRFDEAFFEASGSLFLVGGLVSGITRHFLKLKIEDRKLSEEDAMDMLEASYWATIVAPLEPGGWLNLATLSRLGARVRDDERDHVSLGLQACDDAELAFTARNRQRENASSTANQLNSEMIENLSALRKQFQSISQI